MSETLGCLRRRAQFLCIASLCTLGAFAFAQAPGAGGEASQVAAPIPALAPPSFDLGRLLALPRPAGATLDFGIDPQTLSVSPEGVVRFVLVASSGSVRTVVYQAIRCAGFDYRIEARFQTGDDGPGAWNRSPDASPWLPMADTPMGRTARLIARSGVCEGRLPGGRADDIVRALRTGRVVGYE